LHSPRDSARQYFNEEKNRTPGPDGEPVVAEERERESVCVCMNLLLEREPTASMGESARAILLVRRKPNTLMPTLI